MKLNIHTIFIAAIIVLSFCKLNAQSLTWLGTLGGTVSTAYDISEDGTVVVGNSRLSNNSDAHAFRWTESGGMQDLGVIDGFTTSSARAVSSDGNVIVGNLYITNGGASFAFIWTPTGGMVPIIPNATQSWANDVSADGSVVIGYMILSGSSTWRPFRWTTSGGVEDLSVITGEGVAWGVNDNGSVIVGVDSGKAFRFDGNTLERKTLSGYSAVARAISGNGMVTVGDLNSAGYISVFTWDSVMTNRGNIGFGGQVQKTSYDGSVIVGTSYQITNDPRAFRWTQSAGIEDLNIRYAALLTGSSKLKIAYSISSDKKYIVGNGYNSNTFQTEAFLLDVSQRLNITRPNSIDKFIAGESDTIKWIGGESGQILQIEYSTDNGSNWFEVGYPSGTDGQYIWKVPYNILTTKAKIKIKDINYTPNSDESDNFKIKPYILTRIDANGDYYEFKKNRDQWGFSNTQADMWPQTWWQQFNYQGIDPFTGAQYSQTQGNGEFSKSNPQNHSDWVSWVRAFGVNACYYSTTQLIYNPVALFRWYNISGNWGGSCFGIAAANALAFRFRDQFTNRFLVFPNFTNPITVASDSGVKRVVNELFTHQYGNPSATNDILSANKTPFQTLNELKQMLIEDDAAIRTLSIFNNGGSGAHTILAYGLEQDTVQTNLYYVKVYDNSNPNSNNPITIDLLANSGNGAWSTQDWPGWGGNKGIYLEVPSVNYLNNALNKSQNSHSPFIRSNDELEINVSPTASIQIIDDQNKITGYDNGNVFNDIPGALPRFIKNGNEDPPYGYFLQTNNYSIILNNFTIDTVNASFSTGNKSFMYSRNGANQSQTDNLYFDGGLEVFNYDGDYKSITLLNLISEGTQEKLFIARSLDLGVINSVKIENPDSNTVKITSTNFDDVYDVELNYVTPNGLDIFVAKDLYIQAYAVQTFVPEWTDLSNNDLKVLIDFDNDGTIDDSLFLQNQFTDVKDYGSLLSPTEFNLEQNYPNPFNPTTTIQYSIPKSGNVKIKVYDVLGNEVASLIDEYKEAGRYELTFDASGLSSGVYFYNLQSGSFAQTKKLQLIK